MNNENWERLFDRIQSEILDEPTRNKVYKLVADAYKAGEEDGYTQGYEVANNKWLTWFNKKKKELENEEV